MESSVATVGHTTFCAEGYDYNFVDPGPSDDQKCPICYLVVRNAYQVNCCGKIMCEGCLMRLCNVSKTCPMCREGIGDKYFKDTKSSREIDHLRVFCDYKKSGCEWTGDLKIVERHKENCLYQNTKCEECDKIVLKLDLIKHKSDDCLQRWYKCSLCSEEGTYLWITTEHQAVCPEVVLGCRNIGCGKCVKRCQMLSHIEVCPRQFIKCPFSHMGCEFKSTREHLAVHIEKTVALHVDMVSKQIQVHHRVMPIVLKFSRYTLEKQLKSKLYSDPFYTGEGGYKLRLTVCPNGSGKGESTHVSVSLSLLPGANDDTLEWPLRGNFVISLLNQLENDHHIMFVVSFDDSVPEKYRSRRYETLDSGRGKQRFVLHSSLGFNQVENTQFLKDDTLYFRVTGEIASKTKSWLAIK